jgi:hypothetical protein
MQFLVHTSRPNTYEDTVFLIPMAFMQLRIKGPEKVQQLHN